MLEKGMQPAFRIKCLDRILRIVSNPTSRRNVRFWNPLRPFPPNYYKDHQVFYPSLDTVLREKERVKKGKNFVDIGLPVPSVPGPSRHQRRMQQEAKLKKRQDLKEEELFEIIDQEEVTSEFDYNSNQNLWSKSESGISEIIQIANHYAIFEHLFNSNTPQPVDKVLEKKSIDFWPAIERELTWELEKYYPGAVRVDPPPEKEVNFFHPIVPMRIEFAISENPESDELTVSPVYRGNHITPKYSAAKPDVLIDASFLNGTRRKVPEDLIPNGIELFGENSKSLFTLGLFNLDSQFGVSDPVCHWMVSNIRSEKGKTNYDEVFPFVPPYAFKGFGYHRYVFVLFKQEGTRNFEKVDDFVMNKRIIDLKKLVSEEGSKPVGLSWFQSSWDEKCREIFHQILDMREPTYEYIQPKQTLAQQDQFPGRVPFNVYLDLYRDPKEIKKEVLLERLKDLDPFDYSKTFKESKIPWDITNDRHQYPKWYWSTIFKRSQKLGPYRSLRNPSAILPLNNNADLDYPKWPFSEKLRLPLYYPYKGGRRKPLRMTKWVLPMKDHPHIREYDEDINQLRRDEMKDDLEAVKSLQPESHQKSDKTIS